ncbi:MAG: pyridoxal 5'-phosphate synthase glutaminase subunit PdxT [Lachnospiraceae bacterium]|nr:pyridoxal 5'-phosphate synthase glutaminase subunit PdxT [Lachnospiraceae bacterium]
MTIGIVAVQGAFIEHEKMLDNLGISYIELRQKNDLFHPIDGLILPGGESTVQGKLLAELDMFSLLKEKIDTGLPVLATCAGMILLAESLSNDTHKYFQTMPITVKRNAYGRQLGSFHTKSDFQGLGSIPMTFIRAPYIESASPSVDIVASVEGKAVAARYKKQIALSFHPELDGDTRIYELFLGLIQTQSVTN